MDKVTTTKAVRVVAAQPAPASSVAQAQNQPAVTTPPPVGER
ncbi:hypothetical protein QE380_003051 [Acinetobacter baylyi]|uniref:Uncharacterized protein n=1 Tax=Acinetobacter baylyi TaxID=202950 RepID=A0ABU0V0U9_ACIBI|nr:hypothetical protein [Acinetobacter baylyi]